MRDLLRVKKTACALLLGTGLLTSGGAFSEACAPKADECEEKVDQNALTLVKECKKYSCTEVIVTPAVPAVTKTIVVSAAVPAVTAARYTTSPISTTSTPLKFTGTESQGSSKLCLNFGTAPYTAQKCYTFRKIDQPINPSDSTASRLVACPKPNVCTTQYFSLNNQSIAVPYKWDDNYLGTSDPNVMGPNGKCGCVPNLK